VVSGSAGDIGGELTSNPIVRKLSFTGSTEIGRQLMAECAKDIKKVSGTGRQRAVHRVRRRGPG
jgi:succinate-semialdehyde dehydrogenase/glutarate-semialdehyde dehydrogenase